MTDERYKELCKIAEDAAEEARWIVCDKISDLELNDEEAEAVWDKFFDRM